MTAAERVKAVILIDGLPLHVVVRLVPLQDIGATRGRLSSPLVVFRRTLRVLSFMGVAGAVWSAVLILGLFAGFRPFSLAVVAPVGAFFVVPGFVVSVMANANTSGSRRQRQSDLLQLLGGLPNRILGLGLCLFFVFWLVMMTAMLGLTDGQPMVRDGQYMFNNHGKMTVIDKATYDRAAAAEERLALGAVGAFGVAGAAMCMAAAARSVSTRRTQEASGVVRPQSGQPHAEGTAVSGARVFRGSPGSRDDGGGEGSAPTAIRPAAPAMVLRRVPGPDGVGVKPPRR